MQLVVECYHLGLQNLLPIIIGQILFYYFNSWTSFVAEFTVLLCMKIADNDQKQVCNSSGTISSKVTFPRSDSSQQKDSGKPHWRWWCYQICGHSILLFIRAVQINLKRIGDKQYYKKGGSSSKF